MHHHSKDKRRDKHPGNHPTQTLPSILTGVRDGQVWRRRQWQKHYWKYRFPPSIVGLRDVLSPSLLNKWLHGRREYFILVDIYLANSEQKLQLQGQVLESQWLRREESCKFKTYNIERNKRKTYQTKRSSCIDLCSQCSLSCNSVSLYLRL